MNIQTALPLLAYMALAYLISWAVWWFGLNTGAKGLEDPNFVPYMLAGSFGPTIAALIVTGFQNGWTGIFELVSRLVRLKMDWRIYAFTFLVFPAIGLLLFVLFGIKPSQPLWLIAVTILPLMPVNALMSGVIFGHGPLGEEMGWRGLLQERLGHFGVLPSAIMVGLVWAFWHTPLFGFESFRNGLSLPWFVALYPVSTILIAVTMAYLWRWSNGSLFIAIFFHAVVNSGAMYLTNQKIWDFSGWDNLQIFVLMLAVFALAAVAAALTDRFVFGGAAEFRVIETKS